MICLVFLMLKILVVFLQGIQDLAIKAEFIDAITKYDSLQVSLVAQTVKNLPSIQETRVRSLGWEDSLQKEMATHSGILAMDRGAWLAVQSMESQRVGRD